MIEIRQEVLEMEELLYQLLWSQLQELGLFREKLVILTDQRVQAGISTSYERWLQESVAFLEHKQYLHCHNNICTTSAPTPIASATLWQHWDQHKESWMQNANLKAQVKLVEATLRALPAVLTGKVPATEIMFPNGSMHLVEGIYQHNETADYYNEVLAQFLSTYLQQRLVHQRQARIRILEIGAGTGATTSKVLRALQPYRASIAEYCYTDISEAFLLHGQQTYGVAVHPFMTYRICNVEKPLAGQEIELGNYDLVIATNVLHATRNIRRTVRNVKAALKKHGLLLLNEITGTSLFAHLTFGLLSGWWVYEDPELRVQGCPALSVENWQAVLESEGLRAIYLPTQDPTSSELAPQEPSQQVIVAESDGMVRLSNPSTGSRKDASPHSLPTREVYTPNSVAAQFIAAAQFIVGSQFIAPSANAREPRLEATRGTGSAPSMIPTTSKTDATLREKSIAYLKGQVGKVLNLPSTKIDASEPLINYGLDSILVLQLTKNLSTSMGQVSSTLFFEYDTIEALVEHFLHTQREALEQVVDANRGSAVPAYQHQPRHLLTEAHPDNKSNSDKNASKQEKMISKLQTIDKAKPQSIPVRDIAIIGLTGRYPGAPDTQAFWDLLAAGKSGIGEIPAERWDWRSYFQAAKGHNGTMYTKWGGFLEHIEHFDASFFHISRREAEQMDPQERLFLETSYACIEDAGYTAALLGEHGPVGVFVGVMNSNYSTGAKYWSIANRVSFALGLQGPSMAIDTACSSALTALHCAVESLMCGTSASALVGGVNLIVNPAHYVHLSQLGMLSTTDQCKSFGENADGFVDGEGVGAMLLKPLQQAEADGDHIYGVIKATALNHGGRTNGYTVPNPQAQAAVIDQALRRADIDPRTISYVEAHGTGTELGDPIEIAGLTRAFQTQITKTPHQNDIRSKSRGASEDLVSPSQWCAIGSVKSNIGHTEGAAGIAGITKVLLQMRHRQLVPSLHARTGNPHINFSTTPFVVQQELSEWQRPLVSAEGEKQEAPRRAGLSSFGAGGSNAHVILEEYVEQANAARDAHPSGPSLIILSAHTDERLQEQVRQLVSWIQKSLELGGSRPGSSPVATAPDELLQNLAYTLQVGREPMEERLALQVSSLAELEEKLRKYLQDPQEAGDWYRGQVKGYKEIATLLSTDEELQEVAHKWYQHGKYEKLLQWWVKGLKISWHHLYGAQRPRRISLPTYPFAQERHAFAISSPLPIAQEPHPLPVSPPSPIGDSTSEHGKVLNGPNLVALPSLTDSTPLSDQWDARRTQPLVSLSSLDQSFSQPRTNGDTANGTDPTTETHRIKLEARFDPTATQPTAIAKKEDAFTVASTSAQGTRAAQDTIPTASVLEEELARGLAEALYMEKGAIDMEKPFIDMGLDSIIGVEWIESINKKYPIHLKATCVYDHPTVRQMASFLHKELLKHGGEKQQTVIQSVSILSLEDMLQKVKNGTFSIEDAEKVLIHI